jgi:hypothetical protein
VGLERRPIRSRKPDTTKNRKELGGKALAGLGPPGLRDPGTLACLILGSARTGTDHRIGLSRTFDDPGPPAELAPLVSLGILARSEPETGRLHQIEKPWCGPPGASNERRNGVARPRTGTLQSRIRRDIADQKNGPLRKKMKRNRPLMDTEEATLRKGPLGFRRNRRFLTTEGTEHTEKIQTNLD